MSKESVDYRCSKYLKSQKGADRIMKGFKRKFESLGNIGGNYILKNPTKDEALFLRGLFKRDFSDKKSVSISLKKFEKAFDDSRFTGADLENVMALYFDNDINIKKEIALREAVEMDSFFQELINEINHEKLKKWIETAFENKTSGVYKWIAGLYNENTESLKKLVHQLLEMVELTESSNDGIIRPVAAASITRNPHSLDEGKPLLNGMLYYLSFAYDIEEPTTAEERTSLLERGNILIDSGSRSVMTYGLTGFDINGKPTGWELFFERKEPLILTLSNLTGIGRVELCKSNLNETTFCFENPAVFYTFIKKYPNRCALCVSGQVNIAAYRLFDLMLKRGIKIYYHGDFDPEGLLIADRLIARYENMDLFAYDENLFIKSMSEIVVSAKRLKQLEKLSNPKLKEMGKLLNKFKKAGYEEYIIKDIMEIAVKRGMINER